MVRPVWLFVMLLAAVLGCKDVTPAKKPAHHASADRRPVLLLVIMDPLAKPLQCDCVGDAPLRQYEALAEHLQTHLQEPVRLMYCDAPDPAVRQDPSVPMLIVGKRSVVQADVARLSLPAVELARLSDLQGRTDFCGLFIVRAGDTAQSPDDLRGRTVFFGPPECEEKHQSAVEALRHRGIDQPADIQTVRTCGAAAQAVADGLADAAVISEYAAPLVNGYGTVPKGKLQIIGQTERVPFISAILAGPVDETFTRRVRDCLLAAGGDANLRQKLQSKSGFVAVDSAE